MNETPTDESVARDARAEVAGKPGLAKTTVSVRAKDGDERVQPLTRRDAMTKRMRIEEPVAAPLVRDLMTADVATCGTDASLADAARIMWSRDCGFVPVTRGERGPLCGVVTDRDACMAAYTQGRPLAEIPVRTAMATDVVSVHEDEPLTLAHARMRERRVRRLPVVDDTQRVVGVLSINDVALHAGDRRSERADVATTLREVCRHRDVVRA
jgi:CBS domain-containing protein